MKRTQLTKNFTVEAPENITSILDGDKLESCFEALIQQYRKVSNHRDANTLETVKNALFDIPDIYLWKKD